jgi:hypothetical protein
LHETFVLGEVDTNDEEFFGVIADIAVDDAGQLYVLDSQLSRIMVYDRQGSFVRTIGREGAAPGEFWNATGLFWTPDGRIGVVQSHPVRLVTWQTDGTPADDVRVEFFDAALYGFLRDAKRAGDGLALVHSVYNFADNGEDFTRTLFLHLADGKGNKKVLLHTHDSHIDFARPKISEIEFDNFTKRWATNRDGLIFLAPNIREYRLHVWDPEGTLLHTITRDYEPLRRTKEEREKVRQLYEDINRGGGVPEHTKYEAEKDHFVINWQGVHPRDDGSVWVSTVRGTRHSTDQDLGYFDVFDSRGEFVQTTLLRGACDNADDMVVMAGDRVFVITEFMNQSSNARGQKSGDDRNLDIGDANPMMVRCFISQELDAAALPGARPVEGK